MSAHSSGGPSFCYSIKTHIGAPQRALAIRGKAATVPDRDPELVVIPTDLTLVSDDDLSQLESQAVAEFDRIRGEGDDVSPEGIERLTALTDDIDRIRAEFAGRQARATQEDEQRRARALQQQQTLLTRVHGENAPVPASHNAPIVDAEAITAAATRGAIDGFMSLVSDPKTLRELVSVRRGNGSLSEARKHSPATSQPRQEALSIQSGVDIPGVARGADLSLDTLVDAFHRKARSMPVSSGQPSEQVVATIRNSYEHVVDDRTSPRQVSDLLDYVTRNEAKEALVAGGGWCAPSETRYDFFNVASFDGAVDLPQVGISRGGLRFPTSPSLADGTLAPFGVTFSNTSNPWLWTETDDILTVTGSTNKPCIRVPCPSFNDVRLECYGVCLTAGNLADDAYPEATRHFLGLLMTAHAHAINARIISSMVTLSSAIVSGGKFNGASGFAPVFNQIMGGIELAATDYRARFGMSTDAILEVVLPYWMKAVIRADLSWRSWSGAQLLSTSDAEITQYLADRKVRAQWVNDWQVRGSGQFGNATGPTNWPTTVDIMVYAAGTFVLGNGMSLDLGVIRDSVLNAENDHTAAFTEECHLVARVGNESRQYRITFAVNGAPSTPVALASNL